mmetsp:Transcript_70496/g.113654  ORF Transcript_70496/g.113654 Transcript_70496/m.113654 type:complete len:201 (+) Transcript_70496:953-1555(+)
MFLDEVNSINLHPAEEIRLFSGLVQFLLVVGVFASSKPSSFGHEVWRKLTSCGAQAPEHALHSDQQKKSPHCDRAAILWSKGGRAVELARMLVPGHEAISRVAGLSSAYYLHDVREKEHEARVQACAKSDGGQDAQNHPPGCLCQGQLGLPKNGSVLLTTHWWCIEFRGQGVLCGPPGDDHGHNEQPREQTRQHLLHKAD